MKQSFKLGALSAQKGEKVQGYVEVYETGYSFPVTLIYGEAEGETLLITAGIHGAEYSCIQAAMELANEIEPKHVKGKMMIIHPVNVSAFKAKISAVMPEDKKNINRIFPGKKDGTLAEVVGHFITHECQAQADFYVDLHGGDLYEQTTPFVYYPGIADEVVIERSREAASAMGVRYMVRSGATTGAYNSAALRGLPSLLIERGGSGRWSHEEVAAYKKDVLAIMNKLNVLHSSEIPHSDKAPVDITKAIYLESDTEGCWYPTVQAGEFVTKGQVLGCIKDFFGNELACYTAEVSGVVLYMTVSLAVGKEEPLIAYGELVYK